MEACDDDAAAPSREFSASAPADSVGPGASTAAGRLGAAARGEFARRAAEELEALAIEAGIDPARDPVAPGGDLKRDIEAFTTLDACVRAHGIVDPVLADAVSALGYDALARDACRALQAMKEKDPGPCRTIVASPLRRRCESQAAILAGDPALCPIVQNSGVVPARDPVCLARASHDERLCAAALSSDRAACRALVLGRASECGGDDACVRQVERNRSLLEKPASHTPFPSRMHVEFTGEHGKTEKFDGAFDLDDLAGAGAVARQSGDKIRLMIGTPKSALWPSWDSPGASPRAFLSLSLPAKSPNPAAQLPDGGAPSIALGPSDLMLDLLIPRVGVLTGTLASDRRAYVERASAAPESPLRLTLMTTLHDGARVFRVKIELETFVRDGVLISSNR